jgi:hypothetical protein
LFYYCQSGKITVDGEDIRNISPHWLRQQIGLVTQEPSLFATSIEENIAYGALNFDDIHQKKENTKESDGVETVTQRDRRKVVENMAHLANASDFISKLPDGYQTQVVISTCNEDCFSHSFRFLRAHYLYLLNRLASMASDFQVGKSNVSQSRVHSTPLLAFSFSTRPRQRWMQSQSTWCTKR